MVWAALVAWLVTAGGGSLLFTIWLQRGGMRQREAPGRIRPPLVLAHLGLAAAGLVLWLIYALTEEDALGWIALATLLAVAVLGWTMFFVWLRQRRAGPATESADAPAPAEQNFPRVLVALHGAGAIATVLLVLLALV